MTTTDLPVVTVYTDGACEPNPGAGGWAALLTWEDGHESELSGSDRETTNNRMELTAIIQALKSLEGRHIVELYCDSRYCLKIISECYDVLMANSDLVSDLDDLKHKHKIHFHWIRGGSDPVNMMVDCMAKAAINNL